MSNTDELKELTDRLAQLLPHDAPIPSSADPQLLHYFLLTQTQLTMVHQSLSEMRQQLNHALSSPHSPPDPTPQCSCQDQPPKDLCEASTDPMQQPSPPTKVTVTVQTDSLDNQPTETTTFQPISPTPPVPRHTPSPPHFTTRSPSKSPSSNLLTVGPLEPTVLWEKENVRSYQQEDRYLDHLSGRNLSKFR
ncbi:hypothetical protein P9112_008253 [Eukaryota sp. TZLM1-RC]